jgi:2-polyprenyl-3-methyl-5-hydroxy-6-metoxy-1,4-benzoquinol methylase
MLGPMGPREHWQRIYTKRSATQLGWCEPDPVMSRRLVTAAVAAGGESVIDVGGGASSLVDHLLDHGVKRVAVMDISEAALDIARRRLGKSAAKIEWIVGDVTAIDDVGRFDVWHDRAAFHFLLDPAARRRYVALSAKTVPPGGTAIMATFSHAGPEACSGLPVQRWEPEELAKECDPAWRLASSERYVHTTPGGIDQAYVYCVLSRATRDG